MAGLGPRLRAAASRWYWWLGVLAVGLFGVAVSITAYREGLDLRPVPQGDKLLHFAFSGLLAFTLDGALGRANVAHVGKKRTPVPLALVLVLAPRAVDEIAQAFSVWRTASIFDWLADVVGAASLAWVARRLAKKKSAAS